MTEACFIDLETEAFLDCRPTSDAAERTYEFTQFQGFPSGLVNRGPKDSLCGVNRSLIMILGFVALKRLKQLPKY